MHLPAPVRAVIGGFGRPAFRALAVALLLVVCSVAPAAAGGRTSLVNAEVTPTTGYPTTVISFAVTYRNSGGKEPDYVRVVVGGTAHDMRPSSSSQDWKKGGRFVYSMKLAVGTWSVKFVASDHDRFDTSLPGSSVTIKAKPVVPKATPKPTPKPTPKATPKPTPKPTPKATPKPTPKPRPRNRPRSRPPSPRPDRP